MDHSSKDASYFYRVAGLNYTFNDGSKINLAELVYVEHVKERVFCFTEMTKVEMTQFKELNDFLNCLFHLFTVVRISQESVVYVNPSKAYYETPDTLYIQGLS